jgi:hypothetical protein
MPDSDDEPVAVAEADEAAEDVRAEEGGPSPSAVGEELRDSAVGEETLPKAWAALKADKNIPQLCETYVLLLVQSVEERLVQFLEGTPEAGGISLVVPLQQQAPLKIDGGGELQTTKEHWRWENCLASLTTKGLYEAPGSIFWFSKEPPKWEGKVLPASALTYGAIAAGRLVWSDEKFMRSSDDEKKRRYSIRFVIHHQPIRGRLFGGSVACLLDSWLARWLACWPAGSLACWLVGFACLLAGLLAGLDD